MPLESLCSSVDESMTVVPPEIAEREVWATSDDHRGVVVYQAFKPAIADEAVRLGTFGKGFNRDRLTWIKPSFGWMLYRSEYATKHRQERILRIWLRHEGFRTILSKAIPTAYDSSLFRDPADWRRALDRSEVRYQWDPDRDLRLRRLDRRALQLGLRGQIVNEYIESWIVGIEDVTPLARAVEDAVERSARIPSVPEERVYWLDPDIRRTLGMSHS
jgi:hypothetical protein